jgi:transcriptional regulator with XRE-family HTH domain
MSLNRANMSATKRRKPTTDELADVDRLRAIVDRRKQQEGLTQARLAELGGWESQGTVGQYLNAHVPLNLDAAFRFAKALRVPLDEISPHLAAKAVELFGATEAAKKSPATFEELLRGLHVDPARMDNDGRLAIARLAKTYHENPAEGAKIAKAILALVGDS